MTTEALQDGERAIDTRAMNRSVIDSPPIPNSQTPVPMDTNQVFWFVGQYADEITPWGGGNWLIRDRQLRNFITKEPYFCSALNIICQRNAGFSWTLDGPPRTINQVQKVLETANMGKGWQDLMVKVSIDLYTQDNGAFIETVRERDDPNARVIGLNHLDAARCRHTGNPLAPVIYQDRQNHYHLLRWWHVMELAEMPTPAENLYGMQYCALSRLLMGALIQRNNQLLEYEKTGGRETRTIHLVKGVTSQQMQDAINDAKANADGMGLTRYMSPVVVGTIDPRADVGVASIELAGFKATFDEKLNFDHYMNLIAMAFASDYQDFAPLPGGGLGTGNQSEILHLKNRGKGPARFMKLISYFINFIVCPENVEFLWAEQDYEAEKTKAEIQAIRAQTRRTRIESFEITPEAARQIANDEGDLSKEMLALMGEQDVTENTVITDNSPGATQNSDQGKPIVVKTPAAKRVPARTPNPTAERPVRPQQNP